MHYAPADMPEAVVRLIGRLYFGVLCIYLIFGLIMLIVFPGNELLVLATGILYNYALGFSCFHVAVVNTVLMPREVRPSILRRGVLVAFGLFFTTVALMATYAKKDDIGKAYDAIRGVKPAETAPAK